MTSIIGIAAWIITLMPLITRGIVILSRWLGRIAPRVATGGAKASIWSVILYYLYWLAPVAIIGTIIYSLRNEMFMVMADKILPIILAPLRYMVDYLVILLPPIDTSGPLGVLLSFASAFDFTTPITVALMGWSLAFVVGQFMRMVSK